jgi:FlaA1/EpsC-like NDP-sugar epimerase
MQNGILNWPRRGKQLFVIVLDVVLVLFSMWLAFTLRLDALHDPMGVEWVAYIVAPVLMVPVFLKFGLYRAVFRYTGVAAILATGKAVSVYGVALFPIIGALYYWEGIPRSLILLQPLIFLLFVIASRILGRYWLQGVAEKPMYRLLIYGAGAAGIQTAAALVDNRQYALLGFIDDDPAKQGRTINGIFVFASPEAIDIVERLAVTDILLALPSAGRQTRNKIIQQLQQVIPVRVRSLPGLMDLANGRVSIDDFQDLDIDDLLGRAPIALPSQLPLLDLARRVILVTGAGGSIGAELCRQIALGGASKLLLVEHSEFALYKIHQELVELTARHELDVQLVAILASVCNAERIAIICRIYKPTVIYHAAAYKHVPMVEQNPGEGVINNVLGTLNMAKAAIDAKVDRFVLISTDKAVRPTNIMGASKRVAELILQSIAFNEFHPFEKCNDEESMPIGRYPTCFSMVRFGNVLGSSGSVVPLFRSQIAGGGPVTVTHPEVTRYFMTIPEAVQLVLHAGAMAKGGDLFVLDMGAPIKILDLANRMIALSGRTVRSDARPTGDVAIAFTGLRPGEKLYEELLIGENPLPTEHPRIIRAREDFMEWPVLNTHLHELLNAARSDNPVLIKKTLFALVSGYLPEGASLE